MNDHWWKKGPRWRIHVVVDDGTADVILIGLLGGIKRVRNMPPELFKTLAESVGESVELVPKALEAAKKEDIPLRPDATVLAEGGNDIVVVRLTATRTKKGSVETAVGIYDAEDLSAPVVFAENEEIEQLADDMAEGVAQLSEVRSIMSQN